jgi:hypothetical protein
MGTAELSYEAVAEIARRMKLERVQEGSDEGDFDIHPFTVAVRHSEPIAIVYAGQGPEAARWSCLYAAAMFRADEVFMVADSFFRTYPTPPNEIRMGWMQQEWEAGRRDGISECIVISRVPILGPASALTYPYERQGHHLTWGESPGVLEGTGGAVADYAKRGFEIARTDLRDLLPSMFALADLMELPPADRDYHLDAACAQYVALKEEVGGVSLVRAGPIDEPPFRTWFRGEEL